MFFKRSDMEILKIELKRRSSLYHSLVNMEVCLVFSMNECILIDSSYDAQGSTERYRSTMNLELLRTLHE